MNAAGEGARTPLADLLRPRTLDEVFGQRHLLGPGKPLRAAIASRRPHSMILWGPPGVGKTTLARQARRFDKGGEQFYDQISALHKSVRGSHPDAALYCLGRMLDGGADPRYLLRRMRSMAWDDIGLADPRAIRMVNAAADAWEQLGAPDGHLALAQAVVYLAVAVKSNAGGVAYGTAMQFVRSGGRLPEGVQDTGWYEPVPCGLEAGIAAKLTGCVALSPDTSINTPPCQ